MKLRNSPNKAFATAADDAAAAAAENPLAKYRTFFANENFANEQHFAFCSNYVSTTKYTLFNFWPKFFYEQFSNFGNGFFLFISVLQQFPSISPTNRFTTIIPLLFVLTVAFCKEIYEDYYRRCADATVNNKMFSVVDGSRLVPKQSQHIRVGEVVRVQEGDCVPCDMLLISSAAVEEQRGVCYLDTLSIDGQSSLSRRTTLPQTRSMDTPFRLSSGLRGIIQCGFPENNADVFRAAGRLSGQCLRFSDKNLILRGCRLVNADWIYGMCVFTGEECQIFQMPADLPFKKTFITRAVNRMFVYLFVMLFVMSSGCSLLNYLLTLYTSIDHYYLRAPGAAVPTSFWTFFKDFLTFIILFNNYIPVGLIITTEIVKLQQAKFINYDLDAYDAASKKGSNVQTSNILEDLGQISFILTDKTGTLTTNKQRLKKIIFCNELLDFDDIAHNSTKRLVGTDARSDVWNCLLLCNGFVKTSTGCQIHFLAPEDDAIVCALLAVGFEIVEKSETVCRIKFAVSCYADFKILLYADLNMCRDNFCVAVADPHDENSVDIFFKGAPRISESEPEFVAEASNSAALTGHRILYLRKASVKRHNFEIWKSFFTQKHDVEDMREHIELLLAKSHVIGALAIEDQLAEGTLETVSLLRHARIRIWMVTGDILATSIAVASSSGLLTNRTSLESMQSESFAALSSQLYARLEWYECNKVGLRRNNELFSLAIDGKSFDLLTADKSARINFFRLAVECETVIFWKFSSTQKKRLTERLKKYAQKAVLVVGDGVNDVPMIKAANVGVGISGPEGSQASRASDVAIVRFSHLGKLLLVHGAWSYTRIAHVITFCFYKNTILYISQLWYSFFNLFSGQSFYENWMVIFYNILFTAIPPFVIGFTEQHISKQYLLKYPLLYQRGEQNRLLNDWNFLLVIVNATIHSLIAFFLFYGCVYGSYVINGSGKVSNLWLEGTILYTAIVFVVIFKAALSTCYWTKFAFAGILFSLLSYFPITAIYMAIGTVTKFVPEFKGMVVPFFGSVLMWFSLVLIVVSALMRDFCWTHYKRQYAPSSHNIVQELHKASSV